MSSRLMWLEEPAPAENVDAYKLIAQETSTVAQVCSPDGSDYVHPVYG